MGGEEAERYPSDEPQAMDDGKTHKITMCVILHVCIGNVTHSGLGMLCFVSQPSILSESSPPLRWLSALDSPGRMTFNTDLYNIEPQMMLVQAQWQWSSTRTRSITPQRRRYMAQRWRH